MSDTKTKVIRAKTMAEVKAKIYAAHGRTRKAGESQSAFVKAHYDVAVDYERGDLVATPKSAAPQPAASDVPHDAVRAPDAWIEREGLEALRHDKTSKTQVASGLLKRPFGDKVPLYNTPVPSNWTEEALRAENALLRAAAEAVLAAETHNLHVGYDNAAGGGNFVYADAIRTDDEAFAKLRSALSR